MKSQAMIRTSLFSLVALTSLLLCRPASAQDATFGCKVLLCAAASAPPWSGIPYCVPVMQQLFTQLAKGGGWPSCAQGDASPVGYQPYAACPEGSVPIAASPANVSGRGDLDTTTSYSRSANGGECGAPTQIQTGVSSGCDGVYVGGIATLSNQRTGATIQIGGQCFVLTKRPANPTPYFVDITTANGASRFSFSLAGYGG
jgi:hypothetical protein